MSLEILIIIISVIYCRLPVILLLPLKHIFKKLLKKVTQGFYLPFLYLYHFHQHNTYCMPLFYIYLYSVYILYILYMISIYGKDRE